MRSVNLQLASAQTEKHCPVQSNTIELLALLMEQHFSYICEGPSEGFNQKSVNTGSAVVALHHIRPPPLATSPEFDFEFKLELEAPELNPPEFVPPEITMSSRQKNAASPLTFWKPTELMLLCGNSQLKLLMGMLYL